MPLLSLFMDEPVDTHTGERGEQRLAVAADTMQDGLIGFSVRTVADHMGAVLRREATAARLRNQGCTVADSRGPRA